MKAMNFQDDIHSFPIDNFKDHCVLKFDLAPMQDATENCHYPELVQKPLRLELTFNFLQSTLLKSLYSDYECLRLQLRSLLLLEKLSRMDNVSLLQLKKRILLLKCRYGCSSPSDCVPTLQNDIFAIINTQPRNMHCEHWIMIANSRQKLYFADSLARPSFVKQQYMQMMAEPLQSHPSICGFYAIQAVFISSSPNNKLLEFTMSMYFHL